LTIQEININEAIANLFDSLQVEAGEEGKQVLPVFISENKFRHVYLREPYRKKRIYQSNPNLPG